MFVLATGIWQGGNLAEILLVCVCDEYDQDQMTSEQVVHAGRISGERKKDVSSGVLDVHRRRCCPVVLMRAFHRRRVQRAASETTKVTHFDTDWGVFLLILKTRL
jgi:hypothetical protein